MVPVCWLLWFVEDSSVTTHCSILSKKNTRRYVSPDVVVLIDALHFWYSSLSYLPWKSRVLRFWGNIVKLFLSEGARDKWVLNPQNWGHLIIKVDRQVLRSYPTCWSPFEDWSFCSPAWIVFHNDFVRLKLRIVPW